MLKYLRGVLVVTTSEEKLLSSTRNKRTGYDLKKPNDFAGGSGGYAP